MRLPAHQQFAELRPPVANMIVRNDMMAQQPENPRQRVPQNGRANMPDVHRLGHVGRTEINDHATRLGGFLEE